MENLNIPPQYDPHERYFVFHFYLPDMDTSWEGIEFMISLYGLHHRAFTWRHAFVAGRDGELIPEIPLLDSFHESYLFVPESEGEDDDFVLELRPTLERILRLAARHPINFSIDPLFPTAEYVRLLEPGAMAPPRRRRRIN